MRTHHLTPSALTTITAAVLLVAACSSSDENDVASAAPVSSTTQATADVDGEHAAIVYRDLTAYEISICWRNENGSIGFPVDTAVPGSDAAIGTVHLYVPFDLAGTRLTDVATFTRCSLEPT